MSGICQRMGYSVAALTTFIVSFVMASWLMDVLIQGTGAWGGLNFELLQPVVWKTWCADHEPKSFLVSSCVLYMHQSDSVV